MRTRLGDTKGGTVAKKKRIKRSSSNYKKYSSRRVSPTRSEFRRRKNRYNELRELSLKSTLDKRRLQNVNRNININRQTTAFGISWNFRSDSLTVARKKICRQRRLKRIMVFSTKSGGFGKKPRLPRKPRSKVRC